MWLVLALFLALVVVVYFFFVSSHRRYQVGHHIFLVEKKGQEQEKSLATLVRVRQKLNKLVEHMISRYPNDYKALRMRSRFSDTILKEANPREGSDQTSYTINKGDTMVLCIRNDDGSLVPMNTLMYVAIHELAHIYSSSLYHTPEFWKNMSFLVDEGIKVGIYRATNYKTNPVPYCGLSIDNNIA